MLTCAPPATAPLEGWSPYVLDQVLQERIRIRPLVATRPMDRIRETFEEIHERRCGMKRVVLSPEGRGDGGH